MSDFPHLVIASDVDSAYGSLGLGTLRLSFDEKFRKRLTTARDLVLANLSWMKEIVVDYADNSDHVQASFEFSQPSHFQPDFIRFVVSWDEVRCEAGVFDELPSHSAWVMLSMQEIESAEPV